MKQEENRGAIAKEGEVLAFFTDVMRGGDDEERPKLAERTKAAELIGKYYGTFDGKRPTPRTKRSGVAKQIAAAVKELQAHDKP